EELHRLLEDAVPLAYDRRGLGRLQLEALAAHRLDQDRELQLAPAEDAEGVGGGRLLDPQAHVLPALLEEPLAQLARRHLAPGAARPRASVHAEDHRDGRLVDPDRRERLGTLAVGDRLPDVDAVDARDGDDVASHRTLELDAFQSLPAVQARQLAGHLAPVEPAERV